MSKQAKGQLVTLTYQTEEGGSSHREETEGKILPRAQFCRFLRQFQSEPLSAYKNTELVSRAPYMGLETY